MNEHTRELIRHRLGRATDAISEAKYLLQGNFIPSAAARSYFACFYAVSALLLTKELSSKTHKGTRILFGQHFIETSIISAERGRFFSEVFAFRQEGDYTDILNISLEDAQNLIVQAEEFVKDIADYATEEIFKP